MKLHKTPNISFAFYLFKQLFSSTWDGTSAVSEHISSLQTVEAHLARMKISVESKILSFILLNSLPKTPEWEMFTSSVVNTVEDSKLTFGAIETRVTAEDARLHPSGHSGPSGHSSHSESAMKASGNSRPAHASSWWENHLSATHNSSDCNSYKKWVLDLRRGGFKRSEKGKDKVNASEGTPDPPDTVNMASEHVSRSVMKCVYAYLSSEPKDSGRNTLIIDSGASSHIVPHHSWFRTYQPLDPPCPMTLGDNSDAMAIGIGTIPLISHVSGTTYEITLSNVLLIPEFQISLISVNHLASAGLSTTFLASLEKCYIQKDWNSTLVTIQKNGLFHARVTPNDQKEATHATVDINLLHQCMGHVSFN